MHVKAIRAEQRERQGTTRYGLHMIPSVRLRGLRAAAVLGIVYFGVGILFGTLAGGAGSNQVRVAWRLVAWALSAIVFAAHIRYEHFRLWSSPGSTALHASLAVALGAFALAAAALVHNHGLSGHLRYLAFLVWPVLIALPAFVVAFVSATVLTRARRA